MKIRGPLRAFFWCIMEKEFDVQTKLKLPKEVYLKKIGKYTIVICPDKPNWIVFDDLEYKLFDLLRINTILNSLVLFQEDTLFTEENCINILKLVLSKIDAISFYEEIEGCEEDDIKQIIKTIHITVTDDCNLRCLHCYMSAGIVSKEYLNLTLVGDKIKRIQQYYNDKLDIVVSGGEPLLHPDILSFLKEIKENRVTLFTNGMMINSNNISIISETCDAVQISMEGISKSVFERIRGKNTYDKLMDTIVYLKESNVRVILAITMLPNTIDDIKSNLISFLKDLSYKNIEVRLNYELEMSGNALKNFAGEKYKINIENIVVDLLQELKEIGVTYNSKSERNIRFSNCGIGASIVFDAKGKIYPCNKLSDYYRDISDDIIDVIKYFDNLNVNSSCRNIQGCQSCELKYICTGGCRIDNYTNTGSMIKTRCTQEFKLDQYKRLIKDYLREN